MHRPKRRVAWVASAAAVGLAVVLTLVGLRLWQVHEQTWDWTLWPKEVPSKVQYAERDFHCGQNPAPRERSLEGLEVRGKTAGGADIYAAEPVAGSTVVTFIAIKTADGVFTCGLSGGP